MVHKNFRKRQGRRDTVHKPPDQEGSGEAEKQTRIRSQPPVDWRKEFGITEFELPPDEVMQLCEDIYAARLRQLKYTKADCGPFLIVKSNDALVAMRNDMDGKLSETLAAQNPRPEKKIHVLENQIQQEDGGSQEAGEGTGL